MIANIINRPVPIVSILLLRDFFFSDDRDIFFKRLDHNALLIAINNNIHRI
jgi:hypothetical protein